MNKREAALLTALAALDAGCRPAQTVRPVEQQREIQRKAFAVRREVTGGLDAAVKIGLGFNSSKAKAKTPERSSGMER